MFIDKIIEFKDTIILALTGISITTLLTVLIVWLKSNATVILTNIIIPFLSKFKKEAQDVLTPYENALDTVLEALTFDFETKATNPTLSEYQKEKYLDLAKKMNNFKKIEIVKEIVKFVDKGEDVLEETVDKLDNVKSFIDRKGK